MDGNQIQKANLERLLYTIMYAIIAKIVGLIVCVLVIVQFVYSRFGGGLNERILSFSARLAEYVRQLVAYIAFNSDGKPWPIGEWPNEVQ